MSDLRKQLYSRITDLKPKLGYKALFSWIDDVVRDGIVDKLRTWKNTEKQQEDVEDIYYDLQAFYFAISAQNIETITISWMVYPLWVDMLRPYMKDSSEFDPDRLDHVSHQRHADAILKSFKKLQQKYGRLHRCFEEQQAVAAWGGPLNINNLRIRYKILTQMFKQD